MNKTKLIREQLQATLGRAQSLRDLGVPAKGWIRAIRTALGMTGVQLSRRVGVTKQRTSVVEKQEIAGTATLKTMRRYAEALGCQFTYAFIPKTGLDEIVRDRARQVAAARLQRAAQTMALEDQALNTNENRRKLNLMVDELVDTPPSDLWDQP